MSKHIAAAGLIAAAVWVVLVVPASGAANGTYTNPIDQYSGNRSLTFVVKDNKIVSGEWSWGWMCGDPEFETYSYTGSYPAYLGNNPNPFPIPLAADGSFEASDSFGPYDDPMEPGYSDSAVTLKGRIVGGNASGTLHQVDHHEIDADCTSYGEEWTATIEDGFGPADPTACAKAKAKVKTLKQKLKNANAKQKDALRAKLKKAKAKAKDACADVA